MAAFTVPLYALTARRLHHTNHSGWWQILLIPLTVLGSVPERFVGPVFEEAFSSDAYFLPSGVWLALFFVQLIFALILLIWTIQKGTVGSNTYGEDPLHPGTDAEIFA